MLGGCGRTDARAGDGCRAQTMDERKRVMMNRRLWRIGRKPWGGTPETYRNRGSGRDVCVYEPAFGCEPYYRRASPLLYRGNVYVFLHQCVYVFYYDVVVSGPRPETVSAQHTESGSTRENPTRHSKHRTRVGGMQHRRGDSVF